MSELSSRNNVMSIYVYVAQCFVFCGGLQGFYNYNCWCFRPRFCTVRLYWVRNNLSEWDEFLQLQIHIWLKCIVRVNIIPMGYCSSLQRPFFNIYIWTLYFPHASPYPLQFTFLQQSKSIHSLTLSATSCRWYYCQNLLISLWHFPQGPDTFCD